MKLTKNTSRGEAVITIKNGSASAVLAGRPVGTQSTVSPLANAITKDGVKYTATICGIALSEAEVVQVKAALAESAIKSDSSLSGSEIRSLRTQATAEMRGDISQFNKIGAR